MEEGRGGFLKDNAFLIAATALPLVVAAFFVASSIIPRFLVPPPAYDLVLRTDGIYDATSPRMAVDYTVRDGTVEATVRPIPVNTYLRPAALLLFEHKTATLRDLPVNLPRDLGENDPPRTIIVTALAGRRVVVQPKAPDGYQFEIRSRRGPGIVGEIFGMNHYDSGAALVNNGRIVPLTPPMPYQYFTVQAVGWVVDEGPR